MSFQALADAKNTAKHAEIPGGGLGPSNPLKTKGPKDPHLDTHTPPDIGEFVRAQIVAQKDQPNPVTFTLPDGRKGQVWIGASGIGDARHWRLNIAEADRIDRLAIAQERNTWPVDIMGGQRKGKIDRHMRNGILAVEHVLVDEDKHSAAAYLSRNQAGDDHPLTYDANGYPELPACLDRRPKPALAEAA